MPLCELLLRLKVTVPVGLNPGLAVALSTIRVPTVAARSGLLVGGEGRTGKASGGGDVGLLVGKVDGIAAEDAQDVGNGHSDRAIRVQEVPLG